MVFILPGKKKKSKLVVVSEELSMMQRFPSSFLVAVVLRRQLLQRLWSCSCSWCLTQSAVLERT